jgi:uncharacterized membrane protein YccC
VQIQSFYRALPLPKRSGWRQAIRMTLAALLAYFSTGLVGLHQGYWAVITCLVIVQGSLGATISAGITRVAGTAVGAVLGGIGVLLLRMYWQLPEWMTLLIVIIPLSLLAASRSIFKLAPLTGALVLLVAGSSNLAFAISRVAEIILGSAIGVLVSLFVLPERATSVLIDHAASILEQLGEFAAILLSEPDAPIRERTATKLRAAFAQIQNDLKEVANERSARLLRSDPFPERLSEHLRRLRTDVNMLGRTAVRDADKNPHAELATSIKLQFIAYADALRGHAKATQYEEFSELIRAISPETPLGFALATLQQELAELDCTVSEWTTSYTPLAKAAQ